MAEENKKASGKNTGMAIVALIIFFVPLLTDAKKDPFVKFYVKQGLVLFIGWIAISIITWHPGLYSVPGLCDFPAFELGAVYYSGYRHNERRQGRGEAVAAYRPIRR